MDRVYVKVLGFGLNELLALAEIESQTQPTFAQITTHLKMTNVELQFWGSDDSVSGKSSSKQRTDF